MESADAGDSDHAGNPAGPYWQRHPATGPEGLSRKGLRHPDGNHGDSVRHETRERKQERPDRVGVIARPPADLSRGAVRRSASRRMKRPSSVEARLQALRIQEEGET